MSSTSSSGVTHGSGNTMPQTSQATTATTTTASATKTHTIQPDRSSMLPMVADFTVIPRSGQPAIRAARSIVVEILALSDPASTHQRTFDALRVAYEALTDALTPGSGPCPWCRDDA